MTTVFHNPRCSKSRAAVERLNSRGIDFDVVKKDEGGRHTPFFDGYAPQFFFRTTNVTGSASVMDGVQMAMPSDGVRLSIALKQPIR